MIPQIAMLAAMSLTGGIVLLIAGLRKTEVTGTARPETPGQAWARITRRPTGPAGRRRDLTLLAAIAAGILAFVLSGWLITLILVPAVVMIAPKLLGQAPPSDIPLLEALDRWVRGLVTVLPGGRDVITALRISRPNAPPLIAAHVDQLVRRLDARVPPDEALQKMADTLDNAESDAVLAALKLAVRRTQGVSATLKAVAENIQDRLEALREIEAERSRPRTQARTVTILSMVLIGGMAIFGGSYFSSLSSPVGQMVVAVCSAVYLIGMWLMYKMTFPRRRARILIDPEATR